jgi:hypothetical protein
MVFLQSSVCPTMTIFYYFLNGIIILFLLRKLAGAKQNTCRLPVGEQRRDINTGS